ncbi:RagB/SusD family nutrient uptake outer membrane protein [Pontibacter sp. SGAir0037]|uniref:RagB/SusD family nutrient uptake outer membrane protein n=1 Tax=Pontibacter sp. SGAir0037 TaxID=2571030 RepID=UPI0010CD4146|nr:RagB/SusD family nutrient uptake outer membrane protein [Pontibacter sp. SGAir0037]QCR24683.1 RagB/SusD family nutrient uptake outer membrane protein [Pontibacter sp. SGAir0037]
MNKLSIIKATLLVALFTVASACKDLDLAPIGSFTDANYWTTTEKADAVLNTAYSQMFRSDYFFYNEGMSDNAYNGRGDANGVASLAAGTYDPSLGRIKEEWNYHYQGIKTCHIILENIDNVTTMDPALMNRMKAEARFIRAYHYFQLMTWFGGVPLFERDLTIDEAKSISRSSREEVLSFVLRELDEVAAILPVNTAYADQNRGRVTKGAAVALKARALLYEGRWQEVVTTTEQLINGNEYGTYSLFPSYEGLFLPQNENNSEVILDLQFVPLDRAYNHFFDIAPLAVGARLNALAPTQELVDSYIMANGKRINQEGSGYSEENPYTNRDPRLTYTIVYHGYQWSRPNGTTTTIYTKPGSDPNSSALDEYRPGAVSSPTGYYIRKYYDPTSSTNFLSGLNLILIRYADVLLMHAEAKNELGQMNEAVWNQSVRALRERAGFTNPEALNYDGSLGQSGLRDVIRNERRTELAMEGLRIFDIRRWRIGDEVLNGWVHGAKFGSASVDNGYIRVNQRTFDENRHYLWPIPRDERALNPNLTQNPNW